MWKCENGWEGKDYDLISDWWSWERRSGGNVGDLRGNGGGWGDNIKMMEIESSVCVDMLKENAVKTSGF